MAKVVRFQFGEKDLDRPMICLKCEDEKALYWVHQALNHVYDMIHLCLNVDGYVKCTTIEDTFYNAFLGGLGPAQLFLPGIPDHGYYDVPYIKLEETSDEYIVCVISAPVKLKGEEP